MVVIELDRNEEGSYVSDGSITAKKEFYHDSNLFFKIIHTPATAQVYVNFKKSRTKPSGVNYFFYDHSGIKYFEVYFSKYHDTVPLVLVITTKGSKYFPFSYLNPIKERKPLHGGNFRESELLDRLISENDKLNNVITYRLEKTNNDKIYYKSDDIEVSSNLQHGYIFYKHEVNNSLSERLGLVLYDSSLITLEIIDHISEGKKLNDVQNQKYSNVNVYYQKAQIYPNQPHGRYPFLLELTISTNKYCLKSIDGKGTKWAQINGKAEDLKVESKRNFLIKEAEYYGKNSIKILINKNRVNEKYNVKLTNNSSEITTDLPPTLLTEQMTLNRGPTLSDLKYKCFFHEIPSLNGNENTYGVTGLRLLITGQSTGSGSTINDVEVKLYDKSGTRRELIFYKPGPGPPKEKDTLYVYFHTDDNVPLLIHFGSKFYRPLNKSQYFQKWVEVLTLKADKPTKTEYSPNDNKVIEELKKVNKELNEILLDQHSIYGINTDGKLLENFNSIRVTVQKTLLESKYNKITHSTFNRSAIGKITYNGSELQVNSDGESNRSILVAGSDRTNKIDVYFYISDTTLKAPLLIGIYTSGNHPEHFYQRVSKDEPTKWKKLGTSESGSLKVSKLIEKLDHFHYKFNKSIKIEVDKQDMIGYNMCLIPNYEITSISENSGSKISVSSNNNCVTGSRYTCYRHTIPPLTGLFKAAELSGLRLYIHNKEIEVVKSARESGTNPIYYQPSKNDVNVYFYTGDKVPLLLGYNGTFYKPLSRDHYFTKWIPDSSITSSNLNSSHLDNINKMLNQIELSKIDISGYGLPKEGSKCPSDEFCKRVNVKREPSNGFYNRVTHTTTSSGPIGEVYLSGQKITFTDTNSNGDIYNQVCAYYHLSDKQYTKPLIICIGSNTSCNKWFVRGDVLGTKWDFDPETSNYKGDLNIQKQLNEIFLKLSNFLYLQIEQHNEYPAHLSKGSEIGEKRIIGTIKINKHGCLSSYEAENYRCIQHNLADYYNTYKGRIREQLGLSGSDPTLELKLTLAGNELILVNKSDKLLTQPLTYGPSDTQNTFYVYFYESKDFGTETDKVPFFFKYNNDFFGPASKEKYFETWKQRIDLSRRIGDAKLLIEKELNSINLMLNEIDLSKTNGNYGLEKSSLGNKWTRIIVTPLEQIDDKLQRVRHKTKNGFNIGDIKQLPNGCKFDNKHSEIKNSINQVIVYSCNRDDAPQLVVICESSFSSSYVYGYYDLSNGQDQGKYKFMPVTGGLNLDDLEENREGSEVDRELLGIFNNLCIQPPKPSGSTSEAPEVRPPGGQDSDGAVQAQQPPSAPAQPDPPPTTAGTTSYDQNPQADPKSPVTPPSQQPAPSPGHDGNPGRTGVPGAADGPEVSGGVRSGDGSTNLPDGARGENGAPSTRPAAVPGSNGDVGQKIMEVIQKPEVFGSVSSGVGALALGGVGYGIYAKCIASTATSVARAKL